MREGTFILVLCLVAWFGFGLLEGQRELTSTVSDIGTKVTRMLAVLTVLGVVAQMVGPALLRVLFP